MLELKRGSTLSCTPFAWRPQTEWGTYKLTAAVKVMLRRGLEDPHAQQFLLLSDTDVPIYPPTATWLQLMGEPKSRINGCKFGVGNGVSVTVAL